MKEVDRETIIQKELQQLSLEQESNERNLRHLEEAEQEYFQISNQEHRFYQELLEANQGSLFFKTFLDLENEARELQQKQVKELQERLELVSEEKRYFSDKEEQLYIEHKQLSLDKKSGDSTWV